MLKQMIRFISLLNLLILTACANQKEAILAPALLKPLSNNKAILEKSLALMLDRSAVSVSQNAFVETNVITLEQGSIRRLNQQNLNGRDMSQPLRVHLFRSSGECFLRKENGQVLWALKSLECYPVTTSSD